MRLVQSIAILLLLTSCAMTAPEPQLLRETYFSEVTGSERDYFVYLPAGFSTRACSTVPSGTTGRPRHRDSWCSARALRTA